MDNKRPQAAECTPGKMQCAFTNMAGTWQMLDSGFFILCGSSLLSCPCVRSGSPEEERFTFSLPSLPGTLPLGNPISRPFVLNTLLAFTYFPSNTPNLIKAQESSKFSSESLLPGGDPPELWILFSSLSIEQLEGKDSFLFLLLFFLRPNTKPVVVVIQEHLDGSIKNRIQMNNKSLLICIA